MRVMLGAGSHAARHAGDGLPGMGAGLGPIVHAQGIEPFEVSGHPALEIDDVAAAPGPQRLGERTHAWEQHVVDALRRIDVLGPQVPLPAQHMRSLVLGQPRRHRLEAIDVAPGERTADWNRLVRLFGLPVVEIDPVGRAGHDVKAAARGDARPDIAAPGRNGGSSSEIAGCAAL